LSLGDYEFDASFLWAPPRARAEVFIWVRNVFIVQVATTVQPFGYMSINSVDCAGDILEFIEMAMPRSEAEHIASRCSSPEARAWVREVVAAAVVVGTVSCAYVRRERAVERDAESLSQRMHARFFCVPL